MFVLEGMGEILPRFWAAVRMSADLQSFPDSFYSLTGYPPMQWQDRLFRQLINGKFPSALDLPTGLGKTSVMAIC
jgi:CRISPR/Cas system-associated endonuclease/helicase Cas3